MNRMPRSFMVWVKVKCTLVQALRLCTGRTAHRESRGIALPFHYHGTRGCEGSASRPGRSLPPGNTRCTVQETGWAPGPVWTGAENLTPTGIRSPDRPARSQSLYRLSYPAHLMVWTPRQMSIRCSNQEGREVQVMWQVWGTRELHTTAVVKNINPLASVMDTVLRVA